MKENKKTEWFHPCHSHGQCIRTTNLLWWRKYSCKYCPHINAMLCNDINSIYIYIDMFCSFAFISAVCFVKCERSITTTMANVELTSFQNIALRVIVSISKTESHRITYQMVDIQLSVLWFLNTMIIAWCYNSRFLVIQCNEMSRKHTNKLHTFSYG